MYTVKTSPQRTPSTHRARRARREADHSAAWANRELRATDAVLQAGRLECELLHPVGDLEGYTPAEVEAEQMRAELARRFERRTATPDRGHAVTPG